MSWLRSIVDAWKPKPAPKEEPPKREGAVASDEGRELEQQASLAKGKRLETRPGRNGVTAVELDVNLVAKWKAFQDAIKEVENGVRLGFDKSKGLWFPHKSVEGGTDTLAYGKKLPFYGPSAAGLLHINGTMVDPYKGITEAQATWLLEDELLKATQIARREWNSFFGKNLDFNKMKMKYQAVLVDKVYNTGSLIKGGKFIWKTLSSMILNDDEKGVRKAMVAKYKDPRTGNWVSLTRRATTIADAVYLAT